MKLPAFYLLDAISKNVYEHYARYFTPLVVGLFLDTYNQVDQNIRSKMEEMLLTWRSGSPAQRELFGVAPQVAIERQIWGGDSTQSNVSRLVVLLLRSPHIQNCLLQSSIHRPTVSTAQVLSELEFVLGQKERMLQASPYDRATQTHVAVLHQVCFVFVNNLLLFTNSDQLQLRKVVQSGVSQEELSQILNQLRQMGPPPPPIPPPVMIPPQPQPPQPTYPMPPQSSFLPPPGPYPPQSYAQASLVSRSEQQPAPLPASLPSSSASTSSIPPPGAITNLFNSLLKAGFVSASSTPTGPEAASKAETPEPTESVKDTSEEYKSLILTSHVKLTSSDIMK